MTYLQVECSIGCAYIREEEEEEEEEDEE